MYLLRQETFAQQTLSTLLQFKPSPSCLAHLFSATRADHPKIAAPGRLDAHVRPILRGILYTVYCKISPGQGPGGECFKYVGPLYRRQMCFSRDGIAPEAHKPRVRGKTGGRAGRRPTAHRPFPAISGRPRKRILLSMHPKRVTKSSRADTHIIRAD